MKKSKSLPAVIVGLVLVVSVVAGAGIWLTDAGVPINYTEPYSIRMSDEERYDEDDGWQTIGFKSTTERPEANFSASEPEYHYYNYVEIDNPREEVVTIGVTVSEPDNWDDDMNFTVIDGRVNPGEEGDVEVEGEGSVSYDIEEVDEETQWITVIYELDEEAPEDDDHEVEWEFREGGTEGIWLADVEAPITYEDDIAHVETLEADVDEDDDTVTLNGELVYLRGYEEVDLGFEYREAGTENSWNREDSEEDVNNPMEFDAELSFGDDDLDPETTYEYRALVEQDFDDEDEFIDKGGIVEFTTLEIDDGDGSDGNPYKISDWYELSAVRNDMDANYELTEDLDEDSDGHDEFVNTEEGWEPIGTQEVRFTGNFDGDNHTISDLYIDRPDENNIGLFGHVGREATIKNLCIEGAEITGGRAVGTLIGRVTGDDDTLIERTCSRDCSVEGTGAVGGLIGSFNSWRETEGGRDNPVLSQSFADVDVSDHEEETGNYDKFGGLVGCAQKSTILDSYALGYVTVDNEGERIGGLSGCVDKRGIIRRSYSTGKVEAEDSERVGALVGNLAGEGGNAGRVENSYSNKDTSEQDDLVGERGRHGVIEESGMRDTEDMTYDYGEDTYVDWDFDSIWLDGEHGLVEDREGNENYPALRWQNDT